VYLSEIKVIDLTHSEWDREKSDPSRGEYIFTGEKAYIDSSAYRTAARRPAWYFCWIRNDPRDGYKDVRDHQIKWGYSHVTLDDPYWPEGLPPTNGHYVYGDVVLMKCPLIRELKKREEAKQMSDAQAMSTFSKFEKTIDEAGAGLTTADEQYIDQLSKELLGG